MLTVVRTRTRPTAARTRTRLTVVRTRTRLTDSMGDPLVVPGRVVSNHVAVVVRPSK